MVVVAIQRYQSRGVVVSWVAVVVVVSQTVFLELCAWSLYVFVSAATVMVMIKPASVIACRFARLSVSELIRGADPT